MAEDAEQSRPAALGDNILQQVQQLGRKFEDNTDVTELVDLISSAKNITPPPASDKHTDKNEDVFIAP